MYVSFKKERKFFKASVGSKKVSPLFACFLAFLKANCYPLSLFFSQWSVHPVFIKWGWGLKMAVCAGIEVMVFMQVHVGYLMVKGRRDVVRHGEEETASG